MARRKNARRSCRRDGGGTNTVSDDDEDSGTNNNNNRQQQLFAQIAAQRAQDRRTAARERAEQDAILQNHTAQLRDHGGRLTLVETATEKLKVAVDGLSSALAALRTTVAALSSNEDDQNDDDSDAGAPLQFLQQLPYRLRLFILGSTVGVGIIAMAILHWLNQAFEQWLRDFIPTALGTALILFVIYLFTLSQNRNP